jgi:hypothetical protein
MSQDFLNDEKMSLQSREFVSMETAAAAVSRIPENPLGGEAPLEAMGQIDEESAN